MSDVKGAIMQPTYLPWAGYFNLMSKVDTFVILDDVQFEKQSWQSRNRILQGGKEIMLSVPLQCFSKDDLIMDIRVNNKKKWKKKHYESIVQSYAKSNYKNELIQLIKPVYHCNSEYLVDYTILFVETVREILGIETEIKRSSLLGVTSARSQRIVDICLQEKVTKYVSPLGAKNYIDEDGLMPNEFFDLEYQEYIPEEYQQMRTPSFISHLSIVDVIANIGVDGAKKYISY